jgi:hypothetical protein
MAFQYQHERDFFDLPDDELRFFCVLEWEFAFRRDGLADAIAEATEICASAGGLWGDAAAAYEDLVATGQAYRAFAPFVRTDI